jgi:hypothetical protein
MQLSEDAIRDIDTVFLKELIQKLQSGDMDKPAAKVASEQFLRLRPFSTLEDLTSKISQFLSVYPEFLMLDTAIKRHAEEIRTHQVIEQMRKHMLAGNIDQALDVAKKQ